MLVFSDKKDLDMIEKNQIFNCWQETKEILSAVIPSDEFNIHINTLNFDVKDDIIILTAQNELSKQIIKDKYYKNICETLIKKLGFPIKIDLISAIVITPTEAENQPVHTVKKKSNIDDFSMSLKPEHTFENFVIGKNNQFAQACCFSIANSSKTLYNPLFIYGDSGLGKTHLMQAIGNYLISKNEYAKVFYTTADYFTSLYVEAVRDNNLPTFRKKIRNYDIFLLDDIQFLMNKEGSLTEFFHTFNALENTKKQIILTSDRAPKNLEMDQRIISRLEQGVLTDVTKPDFETRLAILKSKAIRENMNFPSDVLEYIAKRITDNVRKLQGALTHLIVQASVLNKEITVDYAREILNKFYEENTKVIDIKIIQNTTAEFFNVTAEDLKGQSRTKDIVNARQIAMYISRELLAEMSLPAIGKAFGNKDHTTVMHSIRKVEDKLESDPTFRKQINELEGKILN